MKTKRNFINIILCIAITFAFITNVKAASASPYGYTYDDASNGKTVYKYYSYDETKNTYVLGREFYSKASYVYHSNGTVICNNALGSGSKYLGFDKEGSFYIITQDGGLNKITLDSSAIVSVDNVYDCQKLTYNTDDLAVTVVTANGSFYLKDLSPAPESDDEEVVVEKNKAQNRVEIYTNSAEELVYAAYKDGKLYTKIIVSDEQKVLNATAKVRISDTLNGAKFVGFDKSYNVYLAEGSILYRFKDGKWYSAQKMVISGRYKSFKHDDNGFISKIVTTKKTYTIKQLTTESKWKAKKTYAVSKGNYTTMYVKGSTKSYTLSLKSKKLYMNGEKVASNVKAFGFINAKKFVFIKKNGKVYTATIKSPTVATKICSGGKKLKKNTSGLTTKVITSSGTKKLS